ncbi:MAG: alpha/beta hydrolase [Nitrospinota bacterium]|nr:alpha/beta hydrolase [Nitrospinota bacterium]
MNKKSFLYLFSLGIFSFSFSCSSLFYQPKSGLIYNPTDYGYQYQSIDFQSLDGTSLHGWYFPADKKKQELGTIIQFHGNEENMTSHFSSLVWLTREGYNLFTFDYQGYGQSRGKHNQKNLNNDALAALKWAYDKNMERERQLGSDMKFIAYGQSIGGTVLLHAVPQFSNKKELSAVVSESAFYSYKTIAKQRLAERRETWILQPFAYLFVSDKYCPIKRVKEISPTPLLVIHGNSDEEVPFSHGEKIFEEAGEPKTFWAVPGGMHIDAMTEGKHGGKFRQQLLEFFAAL